MFLCELLDLIDALLEIYAKTMVIPCIWTMVRACRDLKYVDAFEQAFVHSTTMKTYIRNHTRSTRNDSYTKARLRISRTGIIALGSGEGTK